MAKILSMFLPSMKWIGLLTMLHLLIFSGTIIGVGIYQSNVSEDLPDNTEETPADPLMVNDTYHLRVEMNQWNMIIYDLNQVNQSMEKGDTEEVAMSKAEYRGQIGSFIKGKNVTLEAVSRDVQHGFRIDELGIAIALNRPTEGNEFGIPAFVNFTLPETDMIFTAYCHIFCGLGHDDDSHKVDFFVGDAYPARLVETPTVSTIFIVLTMGILASIQRLWRKLGQINLEEMR